MVEDMLEYVIKSTNQYIENMPKKERKKYGQFFTSMETARFMANLYSISMDMQKISVLDAGAGSGILSCALIERLEEIEAIEEIELTCFENDSNVLPMLQSNLEYCQRNSTKKITINVSTDNYILSQYLDFNYMIGGNPDPKKYDLVIGNPPYMKISKDAPEAIAMPEVCYGAPNLYFIFAAMGLFNLKENGEMVYIIPRSWTSGAYFKRFREYFLAAGKLEYIHLFVSRDKVFDKEEVLQETIIIKVKKTMEVPEKVTITSSRSNNDFADLTALDVPYDLVVSGEGYYVYLVTNEEEVKVLEKLQKFDKTLPDIGLKMKTGLTVDFRNREILRDEAEEGAIPLFYSQHIRKGQVCFPIQKEHEYVVTDQRGLMQDNRNYLFMKRFTAKEEHRRLQCGVYLSKNYPQYTKISTQNKINFIDGLLSEMSECLVYGLYVLFNSTLYDSYYRILNGSTQVNSTEVNSMPVPDLESIQEMGRILMKSQDMSEKNCNMILEGYCGQGR
ncbi:MAG: Eco57I restriction-modification methylase domain-containing protein [Muribaculum sp.]|nr:Eco57I restriction-modification methylase domain-containing protein [Muribaculum sp.]